MTASKAKGTKVPRDTYHPCWERLWDRKEVTSFGCWEYSMYCSPLPNGRRGYGQMHNGYYRIIHAHRAAWIMTYGPIPPKYYVCHTCDNPPCFNPEHLFLGTSTDNMQDAKAKGRTAIGSMLPQTKLTDAQVREIRERYVLKHHMGLRGHMRSNGAELAAEYGVSQQHLSDVVHGRYPAREIV